MDRLERLEAQQDVMIGKLTEIAVETAGNTASLKEHMAQTMEVRKQTELLREWCESNKKETADRLAATEKFVDRFKFSLHMLAWAGSIIMGLDRLGFFHFIANLHKF